MSKFKLVSLDKILNYLENRVTNSENVQRRRNAYDLLDLFENGYKPFYAFDNEYGEHYIAFGKTKNDLHWAGDESDWEPAKSFYEDEFIRSLENE